jgi:hypothetical protein
VITRRSLGESVGSGPFFKAYVANLLPGQFVQPFIDAAFSGSRLGSERAVALAARRSAGRSAGYLRRCRFPIRVRGRAESPT